MTHYRAVIRRYGLTVTVRGNIVKLRAFPLSIGAGVEPSPLLLQPLIGLLRQPWMMDGDDCGAVSGMNEWQGKSEYWKETCPSAALSTTDPTLLDPGSNPGPPRWEAGD
jgi:hypothetical protein